MKATLTPAGHTQPLERLSGWEPESASRGCTTCLRLISTATATTWCATKCSSKTASTSCFCTCIRIGPRLGPTDNIRFYLYRALRRRLLDTVDRLGKLDSEDYHFEGAEFQIQSHEQTLVEEQGARPAETAGAGRAEPLPKRQKEILYLVYMKGLSYPQAAEVMDIALKSVYNTINVALTTLRNYMRESAQQGGRF